MVTGFGGAEWHLEDKAPGSISKCQATLSPYPAQDANRMPLCWLMPSSRWFCTELQLLAQALRL